LRSAYLAFVCLLVAAVFPRAVFADYGSLTAFIVRHAE
jgi:hypothetical protein